MKRTFLQPHSVPTSFKESMEASRADYTMSGQALPSPRSAHHSIPVTKEGVVTLRPELQIYCNQLEKENKQLKQQLADLKEDLHSKKLTILKLESEMLMKQGRKTSNEHSSSVLAVDHQLSKEQLTQANKQIARLKVQLQDVQTKLSSENRSNTSTMAQLELDKEMKQRQLNEQQSHVDSLSKENKRLLAVIAKGKEQEKRLQEELREKTISLNDFLEKLETDRSVLEQLRNQMTVNLSTTNSVSNSVEAWAREYEEYVSHSMISS